MKKMFLVLFLFFLPIFLSAQSNRVLSLDGDGDFVDLPESASLLTFSNQITVEVWVKQLVSKQCAIIQTGNQDDYEISIRPDGKLRTHIYPLGEIISNQTISLNTWTHIALIYNGTSQSIYINGSLDKSIPGTGNIGNSPQGEAIAIGADYGSGMYQNFFNGLIDEVRVWNVARSQNQIQQNMYQSLALNDRVGLVGYWRFEGNYADSSGNGNHGAAQANTTIVNEDLPSQQNSLVAYFPFNGNANDESGTGNHGIVYNATLTTDRFGKANSAYLFNGTNAYIKASASNLPSAERTVSLWFYANNVNKPVVLAYGGSGVCGTSWCQYINIPGFSNAYQVQGHCNNHLLLSNYVNPPINEWYHWVITTSSIGTKIYINGVLTSSNTAYFNDTYVNGTDLAVGVNVFHNGAAPFTDANATWFNGKLDDIRIYNRELSHNEILDLYNESPTQDTTTTWRMQIVAQAGSAIDEENFAGVADIATEGFDPSVDTPEPPFAPGNYIAAYCYHPDWNPIIGSRFASDIKQNTDVADTIKRWYFDVETNVVNDTVTLTFINDRIPPALGKYLTDFTTGQRVNLRNTSTYKYYNTSTTARKFMLIIGDSTSPQLAGLIPNGSEIYNSGTIKNINWQSSDGTGIDTLFIFVSSDAGANYSLLKQVGDVQTTTWQIPEEYLNHDYSIKVTARDSLANETTIKSEKTFTVVGDSLAQSSNAGWSLISLPIIPDDSTLTAIFGDDLVNHPYYVWGYKQSEGYKTPSFLKFGIGYWLGLLTNNNWDVIGTAVEDDSTQQGLFTGYNIIGNNFVRNVFKNNLLFQKNNIQYTFADAVTNGLISNTIFGYNGAGYVSRDTLELFKGYWLGALQEDVIMIQKPLESVTVPAAPYIVSPTNWEISFSLISNNLQDKIAVLGVRENASNDFDVMYDAPRPPRNPGNDYLEMYFEHTGGNYPQVFGSKYVKDYRSPDNGNWLFKVENSTNSEVMISWDKTEISLLPDSIHIIMKDLSTGTEINMKSDSVYTFIYNGVRNFSVNSTTTDINELNQLPSDYQLHQNYPNPFNPSTLIRYELPNESSVKLIIYNSLGQVVKELVSEVQQSGYYEVNFNASNLSSGIYFYSISATSTEGSKEFRDVKKLMLLK
jgi:hypothetical protein